MFGDPFKQVGRLAQQVQVTRRLNKESRQPDCDRSKATKVMRLMEKGEVDGKHWAQVCRQLHGNLKAEAMRSCLGQLASSSLHLSTLKDCADAKSIRNLLKLGNKGRPCHFCPGGPDSRVHWCHECPVWQPSFNQVALTASAHLATGGNSLWFRPDFRLGFAGLPVSMSLCRVCVLSSLPVFLLVLRVLRVLCSVHIFLAAFFVYFLLFLPN